jgi:hypothetical protein
VVTLNPIITLLRNSRERQRLLIVYNVVREKCLKKIPEMEFLAFLVEVSGHKLESSQTRVLSGFLPSFFHSTKGYSQIDPSFLVLRIFVSIFKTRVL